MTLRLREEEKELKKRVGIEYITYIGKTPAVLCQEVSGYFDGAHGRRGGGCVDPGSGRQGGDPWGEGSFLGKVHNQRF